MKRYLGRIFLCVTPVVIAVIVVVWACLRYINGEGGFKLGVDLSGGTILVYETDPSKMTEQARQDLAAHPEELAASLKRRIDPADLYNVTIRPVPGDPPRVEIILPTGGRVESNAAQAAWQGVLDQVKAEYPNLAISYGDVPEGQFADVVRRVTEAHPKYKDGPKAGQDIPAPEIADFIHGLEKQSNERRTFTGEEIENIKNLIQQQGSLEFRILANDVDDKAALDAAKAYIQNHQNELDTLNVEGKPPPPPTQSGAENGDRFFAVNLNGENLRYEYSWVEMGKEELYSMQLNSAAETTKEGPEKEGGRERIGKRSTRRPASKRSSPPEARFSCTGGRSKAPARSASRRTTARWARNTKSSF